MATKKNTTKTTRTNYTTQIGGTIKYLRGIVVSPKTPEQQTRFNKMGYMLERQGILRSRSERIKGNNLTQKAYTAFSKLAKGEDNHTSRGAQDVISIANARREYVKNS